MGLVFKLGWIYFYSRYGLKSRRATIACCYSNPAHLASRPDLFCYMHSPRHVPRSDSTFLLFPCFPWAPHIILYRSREQTGTCTRAFSHKKKSTSTTWIMQLLSFQKKKFETKIRLNAASLPFYLSPSTSTTWLMQLYYCTKVRLKLKLRIKGRELVFGKSKKEERSWVLNVIPPIEDTLHIKISLYPEI